MPGPQADPFATCALHTSHDPIKHLIPACLTPGSLSTTVSNQGVQNTLGIIDNLM